MRRRSTRPTHWPIYCARPTPIPTCPGWTLADLVTHVGRARRWAATMIGSPKRSIPARCPARNRTIRPACPPSTPMAGVPPPPSRRERTGRRRCRGTAPTRAVGGGYCGSG
ncbi:maleylpyruvate isomerase N-terminal domain-containing protein [Nocardia carnea]|uniref:maleylpyruvate isomerase N-terminal domain-containing protein n=1 Tax=Nocardia carnea TaxID=37328 RepID=UPI003D7805DC